MFLSVIDMNDDDDDDDILSAPRGICIRAWWGIKLVYLSLTLCFFNLLTVLQCTRQLVSSPSLNSPSVAPNVNLMDELATERLLKAYSGERNAPTRKLISNWMST